MLQILEKDGKRDEKKVKPEPLDKEQINPDQEEDGLLHDDKSPKRVRAHSRDGRKDKRRHHRSRSRSPRPSKRSRPKSADGVLSDSETEASEKDLKNESSEITPLKEGLQNEQD